MMTSVCISPHFDKFQSYNEYIIQLFFHWRGKTFQKHGFYNYTFGVIIYSICFIFISVAIPVERQKFWFKRQNILKIRNFLLRYSAAFVEQEYNILNHLFWWCSRYNKFLKKINAKWTDRVGSIKYGEDWSIILFSKLASWFICYLNLTSLSHMRITGNIAWAMKMYGNNINEFSMIFPQNCWETDIMLIEYLLFKREATCVWGTKNVNISFSI